MTTDGTIMSSDASGSIERSAEVAKAAADLGIDPNKPEPLAAQAASKVSRR